MKTIASRDINLLRDKFKVKVIPFLEEVNKNWKVIFVTEAYRNDERQKELYSLWLTRVKVSNHQKWLAIDIWFYWPELYPSDINRWKEIAKIANKYWIDWWYDLWNWDKPHFQDNWILLSNITTMSKYTDIMTQVFKVTNFKPIFDSHLGDKPLTEQEVKELIEIAFARYTERSLN